MKQIKTFKLAEKYLNYKSIGFFEQSSINLLSVLLDKYGSFKNITINDINVFKLIKEEKYNTVLSAFIRPFNEDAFEQLRNMVFDVKTLIVKHKNSINDDDYSFLGINNKAEKFVNFNIMNRLIDNIFLEEVGFKQKKIISWFGNGQDYIKSPEEGGSETRQQDYVLNIKNSKFNFIVRFQMFSYLAKGILVTDKSITYHYCEWHVKCSEIIPCDDYSKIENLYLAYRLVTGKELKTKRKI